MEPFDLENMFLAIEHEAELSGRDRVGVLDWLGMLILMVLSFVPAAIAYFIFFHKISCYVALSEGHGYPAKYLYKGWSEEHMREMAETVSNVTTLPYHRA